MANPKSTITVTFYDDFTVEVKTQGAHILPLGRFELALPRIYRAINQAKVDHARMQRKLAVLKSGTKKKEGNNAA